MRTLVAGAALVALAAAGAPAGAEDPADDPLGEARRAASAQSFSGQVEVRWQDRAGVHAATLDVRAVGGSLMVSGANTVMAAGARGRFIRHAEGGWDLLWPGTSPSVDRPDPSVKYDTVDVGPTTVAGRRARAVEVRQGSVLRQRLALDEETHLLLRREQLGPGGDVERAMSFTALKVPDVPSVPPPPSSNDDHVARAVPPGRISAPFTAPDRLADGYQRVGVYREDGGVVRVLYSDGLYDLSVFEQRGRLDRGDVPARGRRIGIGPRRAWAYSWAGGHVLLWHAGRTVFTMVGDAPLDQLAAAAASLPAGGKSLSFTDRLRRACRSLVTL